MKVSELMSKKLVKVTSITMLSDVAQKMKQENIGVIPVEDDGKLVGLVTDRDIAINAVAKGQINCSVKDIMTANPVTLNANATVEEAIQTMLKQNVRRLPVMDNNKLVGLVSLEDLAESGSDQELMKALKIFHQKTKHQ